MGQGARFLFNFISLLFAGLTVVVAVGVLGIAADTFEAPFWAAESDTKPLPTVVTLEAAPPLPTLTPSVTPPPSPTFTPSPTKTATTTPTNTVEPVSAAPTATTASTEQPPYVPTATITKAPVTMTPTPTLTFTPSFTPTFTPSPTGPTSTPTNTESPFAFIVQPGSLIVRDNYLNGLGCNWQGFAGQVINERGEPVTGIQVKVSSAGLPDLFTISGTNTAYGPSGWEIGVDTKPNGNRYSVQLMAGGVGVSPVVEVVFPNSCQQNLAMINFVQTRAF